MKTINSSNLYFIFDDKTTEILLNFIRDSIYKKYPYKSLPNSVLLKNITIDRVEIDVEYLSYGNGIKFLPYKYNHIYKLYFKDTLISELNKLEVKCFDSKHNKEYLCLRNKQMNKFKIN